MAALSAAVVALTAVGATDKQNAQKQALLNKTETVLVTKATEGVEVMTRRLAGTVVAIDTYTVIPRVSGDIVEQGFKDGDIVKKGQLLFAIDDVRYKAALKSAEAEVEKVKSELNYASSNFNRNEHLYAKNAVSLDTKESVQSKLSILNAALNAAEAQLILAKDDLDHTRIIALYDAKTSKSALSPGNYVTPSTGSLVTLASMDPLRVKFSLSERDFLFYFGTEERFRQLAEISVVLSDGTAYPHKGTVDIIDKVNLVKSADAVQIWAKIANPDMVLSPGSSVTVVLKKTDNVKKTAVPMQVVMHDQKGQYVLVVADGKVEKRAVKISCISDGMQILNSGVKPGEAVILEGAHKVRHGSKVNAVEAKAR